MPTLITSYFIESAKNGSDNTALVSPSFTPTVGELIVVKAATWDTGTPAGTPSGGSLTYTRQATAAPGGFNGYGTIFTAPVSASPGSMTVTLSPPSSGCYHTMVVERWSAAQVAATPATASPINGGNTTTASTTIMTTKANSIVTWLMVDENSRDPAARSYFSGAIEDGLGDGHIGSNSMQYHAYQVAAAAGSQTVGMSNPAGTIQWVIAAIEIQAKLSSPPGVFMTFFE